MELRNLVSKAMQKKMELEDALAKAGKSSNAIDEHEMHVLEYLSRQKIFPEPHDTPLVPVRTISEDERDAFTYITT